MFNVMANDNSGSPWDKIWTAISGLETKVETLEGQLPPQGFVSAPAYDSGWQSAHPDGTFDVVHNFETMDVFVLVLLLQGAESWAPTDSWRIADINKIHVTTWDYDYRIIIWKIQPST